ncbi:MAG: hypothetical protein ACKVOQ_10320 [Cyclobacteriaceae bacterium]
MKHLLPLVGLVMSLGGFCQELMWESGVLITKEKEVLVGSLVYYAAHDAVLLKQANGSVDLFTTRKISSFRFYDSKADINRQFICLDKKDALPSNNLMEIVLNGPVKILRKLKFRGSELATADDAEGFNYFVLMDDELVSLQHFQSKVLPALLKKFPDEIANLIAQKKNQFQADAVAIQIVKEYNQLVAKPNLVASVN